MTLDELRQARDRGAYVSWSGCIGLVQRIAKDGTWADMRWAVSADSLYRPEPFSWSKRQPLRQLSQWKLA